MSNHIDRMVSEEKDLRVRVEALRKFIRSNETFENLDKGEQQRMIKQLCGMDVYLAALSERLMVSLGNY